MQETDTRYYSIILPQGRSEKIRYVAQEITTDKVIKDDSTKRYQVLTLGILNTSSQKIFSKERLRGPVLLLCKCSFIIMMPSSTVVACF